jgi:putative nucleotidyltransferase with HDIG domain
LPDLPSKVFDDLKGCRVLILGALRPMGRIFIERGYTRISYAATAASVRRRIEKRWKRYGKPSMVLIPAELPDADSLELCRRLSADGISIVMVGNGAGKETPAYSVGCSDYLSDSSSEEVVYLRCERALIEEYLEQEIRRNAERHQKMFVNILQVMAKVLEARDPYTRHHSDDVARYSRRLARKLGWSRDEVRALGIAALLHDIGKVGVPEALLVKPAPLTEEEFRLFKKHPLVAAAILEPVEELKDAVDIVKHHHEWFDGSGYPEGLAGQEIPVGARIIHIADAYDCMITSRPYRQKPLMKAEALAELRRCSGTQFDPHLVDVFVEMEESTTVVRKSEWRAAGGMQTTR